MNEKLAAQLNTYKRSLENKKTQSFIYSFLLVFILLVLDMAGVYSLYLVTAKRLQTFSDLSKLNTNLSIKESNYKDLKTKLDDSKFYISRLEEAMPKDEQTEAFAVDIVEAAAKTGLKQRKLHRLTRTDTYVDVRATLQGPSSQIYPFIKEVESMERLVVVKSFDYVLESETAYLQVVMRVFYLAR